MNLAEDGDIYKKFLKKASTLWEDFTTGKKKTKDDNEPLPKKNFKKIKSLNPNKPKVNEQLQLKAKGNEQIPVKTKATAGKNNSIAFTNQNSMKKQKKTLICQGASDNDANKRIIITTTKTKPCEEITVEVKSNYFDDSKSKTGKSSQLQVLENVLSAKSINNKTEAIESEHKREFMISKKVKEIYSDNERRQKSHKNVSQERIVMKEKLIRIKRPQDAHCDYDQAATTG